MQLIIALIVSVFAVVGVFFYARSDLLRSRFSGPPSAEVRTRQFDELLRITPDVPGDEPKAAVMLFEQSKVAFERVAADRAALETRATTLVGLAAAGTGASAFLTGGKGLSFPPLVVAAAAFALVSLFSLLFILRFKTNPQPNPQSLVLDVTVWDDDMRFRICLSLAESYSRSVVKLLNDLRLDRIAIFVGTVSLGLATTLVVLSAIFPVPKAADLTNCVMSYKGKVMAKVECTQ